MPYLDCRQVAAGACLSYPFERLFLKPSLASLPPPTHTHFRSPTHTPPPGLSLPHSPLPLASPSPIRRDAIKAAIQRNFPRAYRDGVEGAAGGHHTPGPFTHLLRNLGIRLPHAPDAPRCALAQSPT